MIDGHEAFLSALDDGVVLTGDTPREGTSSDGADLDDFLSSLDVAANGNIWNASEFDAAAGSARRSPYPIYWGSCRGAGPCRTAAGRGGLLRARSGGAC
ncbi:hypothetical protein [Rhizohabitans arisaemae]|uniref:hypothetical protein n=1 Tax=Rhizohabitans arisaemae TaxID=2720610 RepID=UPI0024B18A09|nr:hypothetical protein [Rhizohabitans arisaemae]